MVVGRSTARSRQDSTAPLRPTRGYRMDQSLSPRIGLALTALVELLGYFRGYVGIRRLCVESSAAWPTYAKGMDAVRREKTLGRSLSLATGEGYIAPALPLPIFSSSSTTLPSTPALLHSCFDLLLHHVCPYRPRYQRQSSRPPIRPPVCPCSQHHHPGQFCQGATCAPRRPAASLRPAD